MKVLVITGDRAFKPGHPRFDLQASALERFEAVYFGRDALAPVIPKDSFDVVSAQDPFWRGLYALRSARRLHASFNVQVHTDLSAYGFLRRSLARFVLRRADSIRVVSEKTRAQVAGMGVQAPITVLPIFIDPEPFRRVRREPHAQKTILWIGRFEEEKDPLLAIDILKQVRERGIDAKLLMLGSGSLERRLRRSAEGLPVEFPGWHPPAPYLATADVVLSTSLHESYGASIIEALSAGVPVVCPDVGVAKEAGAVVVARSRLAATVAEVLESVPRGMLTLPLLSREEWQRAWVASLR